MKSGKTAKIVQHGRKGPHNLPFKEMIEVSTVPRWLLQENEAWGAEETPSSVPYPLRLTCPSNKRLLHLMASFSVSLEHC